MNRVGSGLSLSCVLLTLACAVEAADSRSLPSRLAVRIPGGVVVENNEAGVRYRLVDETGATVGTVGVTRSADSPRFVGGRASEHTAAKSAGVEEGLEGSVVVWSDEQGHLTQLGSGPTGGWVLGADEHGSTLELTFPPKSAEQEASAGPVTPMRFAMQRAHPEPFANRTMVRFAIPTKGHVNAGIFDLAGRRVQKLVDGPLPAGEHLLDVQPPSLRGGRYFLQLAFTDASTGRTERLSQSITIVR